MSKVIPVFDFRTIGSCGQCPYATKDVDGLPIYCMAEEKDIKENDIDPDKHDKKAKFCKAIDAKDFKGN